MRTLTTRSFKIVAVAVLVAVAYAAGRGTAEESPMKDTTVYELRTYTTLPGRLPNLHARFKNHTMKLFEKHGMKNVMYWVPTDEARSQNTLIYVLEHKSAEAAKKSWEGFRADPEWHAARDASEQDGKIVEKVESVFMTAVEYSPQLGR